jgi:undecaprenyl diphosphate synthase
MRPFHIALIPDGNRRWSKKKGITVERGYELGIEHIGELLKWCRAEKIRMLSMWGFSTENFERDKAEISKLFGIFDSNLLSAVRRGDYEKYKVRVRFFGRRNLFPQGIQKKMAELERRTAIFDDYFLNLFLAYGGRQEIVDAVNAAIASGKRQVNEEDFQKFLYTSDIPNPDLIIRTSGEQRLSGFLPWQAAYSEFYFSKKLWPEFSRAELRRAIAEYTKRKRRYGK